MWAAARCALPWTGEVYQITFDNQLLFCVRTWGQKFGSWRYKWKVFGCKKADKKKVLCQIIFRPSLAHVVPALLCKREVWADVWR